MAINLDEFDTDVPAGGIEIELRGETFTIRKQTIEDAYIKGEDITEDLDVLKKEVRRMLFDSQREFNRFWKNVTKPTDTSSALSRKELLRLTGQLMAISRGDIGEDGEQDPKDSDSDSSS
jgi:hypothetical protein